MSSLGFSYAQAARGMAPSSSVSSNPASSASSEHGAKESTNQADAAQPKLVRAPVRPEKESSTSRNFSQSSIQSDPASANQRFPHSVDSTLDPQANAETPNATEQEVNTTASTGTDASNLTHKAAVEHKSDRLHPVQDIDEAQERSKVDEDEWEKVSVPSVAAEKPEKVEKEKESRAAPIPSVNFWTQRSLAHQAKLKEQASHNKQPLATTAPQQSKQRQQHVHDETKEKSAARDTITSENVTSNTPKGSSNQRARERQANNASTAIATQHNDKPSLQKMTSRSIPPVNAESWPTPESAIVDSSRRGSAVDRTEKSENIEVKASTRKAQWQAMPFVPSVKFETQLPNAARRGGRPANGRGRGGPTAQGDRNAENAKPEHGAMAPPPLPKTYSEDRGRRGNAANGTRASSAPSANQKPGASDAPQVLSSTIDANPNTTGMPVTTEVEHSTDASPLQTKNPSRSPSRHASAGFANNESVKADHEVNAVQAEGLVQSSSRQPSYNEKTRPALAEANRSPTDLSEKVPNKDWQKERAGSTQKSENWRTERRGGERAERGRGGYRGRGNHASYNAVPFTSPLPQNGFEGPKQVNQPEPRNRQPSQPHVSPYGSTRGNPRSQSIPLQMLQGGFYQPAPGFPSNMPPIQTETSYPGYNQMPNIPGSIMSAMPYSDQLGGFALISMVVTQMEYYFSLDNLCKDMYLRKHMDSQGFVPLRVIGEFRRIKALLGDSSMSYDQLRNVAQQVRNVEFVIGEDGEERLRNRENWKDFVLPMEERLPQAQNDGPRTKQNYPRYPNSASPDFHMSNGLRSAPPHVNGFHESLTGQTPGQYQPGMFAEPQATEQWASHVENARQGEESRRDSLASPLNKVQSLGQDMKGTFGSLTNGHRDSISSSATGKENTFPDEEVAKLKVVVRDPDYQGDDKHLPEEPFPSRVSGLRGSAGSPDQFEKVRALQFGQNANSNPRGGDPTIYFTQGEAPPHYLQPGYIHEEYYSLREKALSQRAEGHFGGACVPLYPLWAEFLTVPTQFNVSMYEDFRTWALEDLDHGNDNGKVHLVKFYDTMLSSKTAMSERLAMDVINLARKEPSTNRPIWLKLRTAWRNGATNMKTRKRLTDLLTREEQTELERGA